MGWFSKKKGGGSDSPPKSPDASPGKPSRQDIQAQAMKNVREARAAIGPEALDKIAAAMQKKQASDLERAKDRIKALDKAQVADALRSMIEGKE